MNRLLIFSVVLLSMFTFASCSSKPNNDPESIYGNKVRPDWQEVKSEDISVSMTAVVKVDLTKSYSQASDVSVVTNDVLAAFAGSQCCGIANPIDGLFYLYISDPKGEQKMITLRYYSSVLKNIFYSEDSFVFVNESRQGNVNEPFVPTFVVEK